MTNRFSRRLLYPAHWAGLQWRLLRQQGVIARSKTALRKVAGTAVRFVDRSTRRSVRLRQALLSLARKLGIQHRLMRFYQHVRMQQAARAHRGRVFELSESQKRAQSAWLPQARKLEVDELMNRIRTELQDQVASPASTSNTLRKNL